MWLFGTLLFVAVSGGLLNGFAGDYPVLIVIGACFGGLIGGAIFKTWSRAMSRARRTFFRIVCRFVLMFTALLVGSSFIINMGEQFHLLIAAFIVILLVRLTGKLVKMYYMHLQRRLTIASGNRRSIHIISRKKPRQP